jgi:hypothetical protein
MEMPKNEQASPHGALIHDVSRSSQLTAGTLTSEQELMQLAHDPVLVRAFIRRKSTGTSSAGGGVPAVSVDAAIALAEVSVAQGARRDRISPSGLRQYEDWYGVPESSIFPTEFLATAEDSREALDHVQFRKQEDLRAMGARGKCFATAMLAAGLILFITLLVPG